MKPRRGTVPIDGLTAPRAPAWTGSTELVAINPGTCPACATELRTVPSDQPALFFHGGYGATLRTVRSSCEGCGWSLVRECSEVRPA